MSNKWTAEHVAAQQAGKKPGDVKVKSTTPLKGRRGAIKVVIDGVDFDSTMEGNCYRTLKTTGFEFELQVTYPLQPLFRVCGVAQRAINYTCDFVIKHNGHKYIVDVKGHTESAFLVKRKIMLYQERLLTTVQGHTAFIATLHLIKAGKSPIEVYEQVDMIHNKKK